MIAVVDESKSGRRQGRPQKPTGPGVQVRVDAELAKKLKIIAFQRGEAVADILNALLSTTVDRMYLESYRALGASSVPPEGAAPPEPATPPKRRGPKGGAKR
jgi:hypothetical protein